MWLVVGWHVRGALALGRFSGWFTHLTMSAGALTFTQQAGRLRSQECLRSSQGLFGKMLCEHLQCRLESLRAHSSRRFQAGAHDLGLFGGYGVFHGGLVD